MAKQLNEESGLIVSRDERLPPPFDRHIASLSLRSEANSATPDYDVVLSAEAGSEIITFDVEGSTIEALMEIYQAEIELTFPNSLPIFGKDWPEYVDRHQGIKEAQVETTEEIKSEFRISASSSPSAAGILANSETNKSIFQKKFPPGFEHKGLEVVKFGNSREKVPLCGPQIINYSGWKVIPNNEEDMSGTVAKFNVRKHWIGFRNVNPVGESRFARTLNKILDSKHPSDQLKAKLFPELLKTLSFMKLQNNSQDQKATLAVAGLRVSPAEDEAGKISLPMSPLLRFVNAPEGRERNVYEEIVYEIGQERRSLEKPFLPQSSYLNALAAFRELGISSFEEEKTFDRDRLVAKYGRKLVEDLASLGVIVRTKSKNVRFHNPITSIDLTKAFQAIVKRQPTVKFVDALLAQNPNMNGESLGSYIASEFQRDWSSASKRRYGNQLRGWANFEGNQGTAGPRLKLSDAERETLERLKREGLSNKRLGEIYGCSPETIRRRLLGLSKREKSLRKN